FAADQGRFCLIFSALEADARAFVYQTGLVMEKSFCDYAGIQECQGTAVPSPFLHWCDPLGGNGAAQAFVVLTDPFMGLLVVVLFEEDLPVLVQLFQCPDLMRFCFPQVRIHNLMEFFTFTFRFSTRPGRMADCDPKFPQGEFQLFCYVL